MAKITNELAADKVKAIDARIAALKEQSKTLFKTAGVPFSMSGAVAIGKPIAQRTSVEDLFAIGANLKQYATAYEEFAKTVPTVGSEQNPKPKHQNISIEDWLFDVTLRIAQLRRDRTLKALQEARDKMLTHAPDLETELEQNELLDEIDGLLG